MANDRLIQLLNSKAILNIETVDTTSIVFASIKKILKQFESKVKGEGVIDSRIKITFSDRGTFEAELKIADEVIIFIMHTNAFVFDPSHPIMKSGYIGINAANATCGMISIYNFQSDSLKYDRKNDIGILIARMFVNKESHFFVEGRKQLGILYNDYSTMVSTSENLLSFIETCIVYCLEIDVAVPPIDAMKQISVFEAMAYNLQSTLTANTRLGFKFQNQANETPEA